MAFVSQEKKAQLAPAIKAVLAKHGLKGSLSVKNHSTLALTIKSGKLDFIKNYLSNQKGEYEFDQQEVTQLTVNTYWINTNFSGKLASCLNELVSAMKGADFFDHSDPQTDYFNVSHYVSINIGKYDAPYQMVK